MAPLISRLTPPPISKTPPCNICPRLHQRLPPAACARNTDAHPPKHARQQQQEEAGGEVERGAAAAPAAQTHVCSR